MFSNCKNNIFLELVSLNIKASVWKLYNFSVVSSRNSKYAVQFKNVCKKLECCSLVGLSCIDQQDSSLE
jgi:hypothetical protein